MPIEQLHKSNATHLQRLYLPYLYCSNPSIDFILGSRRSCLPLRVVVLISHSVCIL